VEGVCEREERAFGYHMGGVWLEALHKEFGT
jgi:hypothetical protein